VYLLTSEEISVNAKNVLNIYPNTGADAIFSH